jgi:aminotransferase
MYPCRNQEIKNYYKLLSEARNIFTMPKDQGMTLDAANISRLGDTWLFLESASGNRAAYEWLKLKFPQVNIELCNLINQEFDKDSVMVLNQYNNCSSTINEIVEFCQQNDIILVEDAAGAIGSQLLNKHVGTFGDFGIWSFDAMKTITSGDGGMLYIKDIALKQQLEERIYLGLKNESGVKTAEKTLGKWWEFEVSGAFNRSILNDIQSALGLSQLKELDTKLKKREILFAQYESHLSRLDSIQLFPENPIMTNPGRYIMPIQVGQNRNDLAIFLKNLGIYTTFRYFPVHKTKFYSSQTFLPNSEVFSNEILLLPMHSGLSLGDVDYIVEQIEKFFYD